jgi:hypothetical protein
VKIKIDDNIISKENNINILNSYFYLLLLIMDNTDIINYTFSFNFIEKIYKQDIIDNNNEIKKFIIAKIIIGLIDNYENDEENNEEKDIKKDELELINKKNRKIIEDNITIFKDIIGLEWNEKEFIESKNIDDIYIGVVEKLLLKKNFENSDETYKIIEQLDLLSIYSTQSMFDKLNKNLNENHIKKYIIEKKEDLIDETKINFYYFLLKYILKNSFYIYRIPFLIKTRQFFIKYKKTGFEEISNTINNYKLYVR